MAKTKMASETIESKNKALVLEAFDTLFNKRDYAAAERIWSRDYIQHAQAIMGWRENGCDGQATWVDNFESARQKISTAPIPFSRRFARLLRPR